MTDWPALLDAMDDGLAAFPPVLVDLESLAGLGALPAALAGRAEATLRRMAEVEAVLDRERSDLARELAALSALKATTPLSGASSVPNFLDTKA
ncbi:MAG TPA: hypothetical protein VJS45_12100 [Acidimicrobiia bacterium]|jgi:hypothetical protein|nr:hypothetical protein [Acidimicrobiia bacterium]